MALVKAGWFQTTWFPSRWWQENYWLEYGTYVPPAPTQPIGGGKRAIPQQPKQVSPETLGLIKDYLELKTRNA